MYGFTFLIHYGLCLGWFSKIFMVFRNFQENIMKTFKSKAQTPSKAKSVFESVIKCLDNPGLYPLDTLVCMGQLFDGPSQNDASNPAHFQFQDLANSDKKIEDQIRQLCLKTFEVYKWKLNKVGFKKLLFL